jgi:hypothetical protein
MARGLPTTGVSTGGGAIRLGEQTMKRHVSDHPCPRPGCGGSALYQWDSDEGPEGGYVLICESCRREIKEL